MATSPSDWVHAVGLDCNNAIWVWFKKGQKIYKRLGTRKHHGPGWLLGHGGIPHICCLYPGTAGAVGLSMFVMASAWPYAGEFVHAFLYRKWAYQVVSPPTLPCRGCNTTTTVTSSKNPSCSGDSVTLTATVTDNDGSNVPTGTVTFSSNKDGPLCSNVTLDATGKATCTLTTLSTNTHTITATYTPTANSGFNSSTGTLSQVVETCVSQCGCNVPTTLTITFSGNETGSGTLTWSAAQQQWMGLIAISCGGGNTSVNLRCGGGIWNLTGTSSTACVFPLTSANAGGSCTPFSQTFSITGNANCCNGVHFTATVTA
jgi:hypothetical protein